MFGEHLGKLFWEARSSRRLSPACIYGEHRTSAADRPPEICRSARTCAGRFRITFWKGIFVPKSAAKNARRARPERALILSSPRGKVQFIDRNARKWLKQLFGSRAATGRLPRELREWLSKSGHKPFALSLSGKMQHARLCFRRKALTNETLIVALELVTQKTVKEMSRREHGLTAREREVLFWLARGKTNADIAAILGVAPATIGKHLERIYPKLGVENRTAASMISQSFEVDDQTSEER